MADTSRARDIVDSWQKYLDANRNEISAIQLAFEANENKIDFQLLQDLAVRIERPPYNWTPDIIWNAYATLGTPDRSRTQHHTLTDLISLLRLTVRPDDELIPYADRVQERYRNWLAQQKQADVIFSEGERWWLDRIAEVIASSAGISPGDLDEAPFTDRGGVDGALRDLGDQAADLINELNAELTA